MRAYSAFWIPYADITVRCGSAAPTRGIAKTSGANPLQGASRPRALRHRCRRAAAPSRLGGRANGPRAPPERRSRSVPRRFRRGPRTRRASRRRGPAPATALQSTPRRIAWGHPSSWRHGGGSSDTIRENGQERRVRRRSGGDFRHSSPTQRVRYWGRASERDTNRKRAVSSGCHCRVLRHDRGQRGPGGGCRARGRAVATSAAPASAHVPAPRAPHRSCWRDTRCHHRPLICGWGHVR